MKPLAHRVAIVVGLALLFTTPPSWGETPVCAPRPSCPSTLACGCNSTASDSAGNTAGGASALQNTDPFAESCVEGYCANTAFGFVALESNTFGFFNTATGAEALARNTVGRSNTATGMTALGGNTTGFGNTAVGSFALAFNTTGSANTATGAAALDNHITGDNNTATGFHALFSNGSGARNTALGTNALVQSTGNKNIAIGFRAGSNLVSGHNNIYVGSEGVDSTEFQTMRLGKAQTRTFIAGINTATVSDATVMIDTTTGQLGIATSSARYKQDIAPMGASSEGVLQLRPVTFAYKQDGQHVTHYGLIAEEVAALYPELVTRTAAGEVQTVKYQELIPMLLNELQRQRQEFQQQLAELRALVGQRRATEAIIQSTTAAASAAVPGPRVSGPR